MITRRLNLSICCLLPVSLLLLMLLLLLLLMFIESVFMLVSFTNVLIVERGMSSYTVGSWHISSGMLSEYRLLGAC
jgi:hypothetical protein